MVSELDATEAFAVLGAKAAQGIAQTLSRPVAVGNTVGVGGRMFTVIGILRTMPPNPLLGLDFDQSVLIPFKAARRLTRDPQITLVAAKMSANTDGGKIVSAIANHFLSAGPKQITVSVQTAEQLIAGVDVQMRVYGLLLLAIGSVSLMVAGVGIMNVMLMSVMERRREIGLRMAVGASRANIRRMFLAEALMLSVVGCLIGTLLGYLAGWFWASSSGWKFEAAPFAVPLAVGMAAVVGLLFGSYPANRAASLDPIMALRG